jgi:hypothetical protein
MHQLHLLLFMLPHIQNKKEAIFNPVPCCVQACVHTCVFVRAHTRVNVVTRVDWAAGLLVDLDHLQTSEGNYRDNRRGRAKQCVLPPYCCWRGQANEFRV